MRDGVAAGFVYEALVEKGAGLVHDGHMSVEDLEIPTRVQESAGEVDFTAEELRDDVRAYLDEHALQAEPEDESGDEERPVTDGVDWDALWSEFGFDTPGPLGGHVIYRTQLVPALEVWDGATGNPADYIQQAVDEGILKEITTEGTNGDPLPLGYALQRGGGA